MQDKFHEYRYYHKAEFVERKSYDFSNSVKNALVNVNLLKPSTWLAHGDAKQLIC